MQACINGNLVFVYGRNLEGNQLSGAIPIQLLARSENSTLQFKYVRFQVSQFFFFEVQVSHLRNIYSFFIFHVMSQCFIS